MSSENACKQTQRIYCPRVFHSCLKYTKNQLQNQLNNLKIKSLMIFSYLSLFHKSGICGGVCKDGGLLPTVKDDAVLVIAVLLLQPEPHVALQEDQVKLRK